MNEIIKALEQRRSIKKYKPDMVPMEVVQRIARAGTYAANGQGLQSAIIIAVTDNATRDELSKLNASIMNASFDPFYGAPVVYIVLADKNRFTALYDGSLVIGNLMLAAYSEGLGSCWIHRAKEEFETEQGKKLLEKLGIKGDYEGVGHCIIGYPDCDAPKTSPRKENYIYYI